MDKFILTHLIKEIILEEGRAVLPGFGFFSTEPKSAHFSKDGRIINPPTNIITFTENTSIQDDNLLKRYADKMDESTDTLRSRMESIIRDITFETTNNGSFEFTGFGTLVLSQNGAYSFIQEQGKDIFLDRDGLESIMLRPIEKEPEQEPDQKPEPEPVIEPGTAPEPEPTPKPAAPKQNKSRKKEMSPEDKRFKLFTAIIIILTVIILAAIALILGRNGAFDTLLYSDEELELIESTK